jgi:hypothetical protein
MKHSVSHTESGQQPTEGLMLPTRSVLHSASAAQLLNSHEYMILLREWVGSYFHCVIRRAGGKNVQMGRKHYKSPRHRSAVC